MSKKARSARGEVVDFDLLAIKQQLAATPVPVSVDERRKFIDEKDGLKSRHIVELEQKERVEEMAGALALASDSARISAEAASLKK